MSQSERNDHRSTGTPRQVTYFLFDPTLLPEDTIWIVHRAAFAGVVVGRSRKRVESENPGLKAVPIGRLSVRERRWVSQ